MSAARPPCLAKSPDRGYLCTLHDGHYGRHEAHGPLPADRLIAHWPPDVPVTQEDPHQ